MRIRVTLLFNLMVLGVVAQETSEDVALLGERYLSVNKVLSASDCFDYHDALQYLGLNGVLERSGPFTVFFPETREFDEALWQTAQERDQLYALTTYHMISGAYTAAKILQLINRGGGKATFTTVEGGKLNAELEGVNIVISDSLGHRMVITKADVIGDYGVVHNIDGVLIPTALN